MRTKWALTLWTIFWLGLAPAAAAETPYPWLENAQYNPEIPSPEAFLGYQIGTFLTDHHQMEDYIHRLEAASDRIRVIRIGESVERRIMYVLVVSSPENLARIESIRQSMERLADPRTTSPEEAEAIINQEVPVGWLNYANDGGETAAFETGILMAYQLAAGTDPLTMKILRNVVTIINPAANPDSHQSFVSWMKAATIGPAGTADPNASEHHVPWFISSDGNHFLIDSNRDAFALTQPETQAVSAALQHWHPQLWIDNHGEPNEYFFAPFTAPMNLNFPASLRRWATEIGRSCARYFDRQGWTYSKDETYDLYYPGYWDSYPALHGAISATFETNGGGWKNLSWKKPDGTLSTLRGGIHGHFLADLASLETLADHRADFLRYFYDFRRSGMSEVDQEPYRTYLFPPSQDLDRRDRLVRLLVRHGIEVYQLTEAFTSPSTETFFDRQPRSREFPAGTLAVPLRQPQKRLIKTLLEPDPRLEQAFLDSVGSAVSMNQKLGRDTPKEPVGFYDVTAWSLPLAFGVDTAFTGAEVNLDRATRLDSTPSDQPQSKLPEARYAYLFSWNSDAGARLAVRLINEDFRLALATRPFVNSGRKYPSGTLIARVERNPENLHDRIQKLAQECGTEVSTTDTAWGEEGISLGSRFVVDLSKPKVLVFSDEPTRAVTFGSVYALLSQRFDQPFTAVRADYFDEVDLYQYSVVVLPDGSPAGYRRLLGPKGIDRLQEWIRNGGTLIGLKGGAEFATLPEVEFSDVTVSRQLSHPDIPEPEDEDSEPIPFHPGSIFRIDLNPDYYLALGYPTQSAVLFRGNQVFSTSTAGTNVAVFPADSWLQGHRWPQTNEMLEGELYLADLPMGEGHVILFADDPTFRAQWVGLDRLVMAAILFSNSF